MIQITTALKDIKKTMKALNVEVGLNPRLVNNIIEIDEEGKTADGWDKIEVTLEVLNNVDIDDMNDLMYFMTDSLGEMVNTDGNYEPHDPEYNQELKRFLKYKKESDEAWLKSQ